MAARSIKAQMKLQCNAYHSRHGLLNVEHVKTQEQVSEIIEAHLS